MSSFCLNKLDKGDSSTSDGYDAIMYVWLGNETLSDDKEMRNRRRMEMKRKSQYGSVTIDDRLTKTVLED